MVGCYGGHRFTHAARCVRCARSVRSLLLRMVHRRRLHPCCTVAAGVLHRSNLHDRAVNLDGLLRGD